MTSPFREQNMDNKVVRTKVDPIALVTHYGNMRFAMFTVFSALLGGLISFPFSDGGRLFFATYPTLKAPLGVCGVVLSILFTLAELRISYLLTIYQNHLYDTSELPKPVAHIFWACLASLTMVAPFVISALFWMSYWASDLAIPACAK
ncbi:MAG: hypothetical protein EOP38_12960 [Rubrivivax sp.]|nr:MAG: hypothetical protein EOP38_12960 [Rubrivivax sp.]